MQPTKSRTPTRRQLAKMRSDAAAILGRSKTPAKSAASRINGRFGGRPSSGLAPVRELRRRIRHWCQSQDPACDRRRIAILTADALAWRNEVMAKLDTLPGSRIDNACILITSHPLYLRETWRPLLLETPVIL